MRVLATAKKTLERVYMRKNVPATARQPSVSVNWDDFNFRLHEKFHPSLQE